MFAILNGQLCDAATATVSITDRGFVYGDGLFETLRVQDGNLTLWPAHWERFLNGARHLGIAIPCPQETLLDYIRQLLNANHRQTALVRIQLTRGNGPRGYSPKHAGPPTLLITPHDAPELPAEQPATGSLITASIRLPGNDPLFAIKTCNRLHQILARAESDADGADEALMLNQSGTIACASAANVFIVQNNTIMTPPVEAGALPGVTRATILELAENAGLKTSIRDLPPHDLKNADGVFLTQCSRGVLEVLQLDHAAIARSSITTQLYQTWRKHIMAS